MSRFFLVLAAMLALAVQATPALAHKAIVFGYVENGELAVEAGFSGGKPCIDCPVQVLDAKTGKELASARTGGDGACRIPLPEAAREAGQGLKLILHGGEGHQGEWLVQPDEYMDEPPAKAQTAAPSAETAPPESPEATLGVAPEELRRIVDQSLDAKLAPIKRALYKDEGPSVSEVLGGIGYLVGLAGVYAWARSRKEKNPGRND